jgi:hypothetical protein
MIEFMLENLSRELPTPEEFCSEAKEFLLDIGLPDWKSESAIVDLLQTHVVITLAPGSSRQATATPQRFLGSLFMVGTNSAQVSALLCLVMWD